MGSDLGNVCSQFQPLYRRALLVKIANFGTVDLAAQVPQIGKRKPVVNSTRRQSSSFICAAALVSASYYEWRLLLFISSRFIVFGLWITPMLQCSAAKECLDFAFTCWMSWFWCFLFMQSARCSASQTQTVTREARTITHLPGNITIIYS